MDPDKSDSILFSTSQHEESISNLDTVNVAGAFVLLAKHIKLLTSCVKCQSHFLSGH